MDNARILAEIIGPAYLVFGLSMLLYVDQWKKLVKMWAKDHLQLFTMMIFGLVVGLIIVNMYSVWAWELNVVITITGWGGILKGLLYFLAPENMLKGVMNWQARWPSEMFYLSGSVFTVIGVLMSYNAYLA